MPDKIIEPLNVDFDKLAGAIVSSETPVAAQSSGLGPSQTDFLFFNAGEDGESIRVYVADEDVWITQNSMAEVFGVDKSGVSRHLKNIFDDGELDKDRSVANIATVLPDGRTYKVDHYNLDAILSVGYRINSRKAVLFRKWASTVLREYLIKGFVMDDERLKQGDAMFGKDYFDELLKRIRDIRTSERRFYEKIRSIYKECSYDYDADAQITQEFYAFAQNKLAFAITGETAAEIVASRADHTQPNMGLTSWRNQKSGGKIRKDDTPTAKNYLSEDEVTKLNRLASQFLDFAEGMAERGKLMSMNDWLSKLDDFLTVNEYEILRDYGTVKARTAKKLAATQYDKFKPIRDAGDDKKLDNVVKKITAKQASGSID